MSTQAVPRAGVVYVDGVEYRAVTEPKNEANKLLEEVYAGLWAEAYCDAYNDSTRKFAKPLADKMIRLNKILGFRK